MLQLGRVRKTRRRTRWPAAPDRPSDPAAASPRKSAAAATRVTRETYMCLCEWTISAAAAHHIRTTECTSQASGVSDARTNKNQGGRGDGREKE